MVNYLVFREGIKTLKPKDCKLKISKNGEKYRLHPDYCIRMSASGKVYCINCGITWGNKFKQKTKNE